jgi:DNA-binding CsgD family transcriptional regulator
MANVLKMATVADIVTLIKSGHSDRRISAVLSLDRGTVAGYRQLLQAGESPALPGESTHPKDQSCVTTENPPNAPIGPTETAAAQAEDRQPQLQNPPKAPTGLGLTAQRIWQDLLQECFPSFNPDTQKRGQNTMTPEKRHEIILRFHQGQSIRAIARHLQMSQRTVSKAIREQENQRSGGNAEESRVSSNSRRSKLLVWEARIRSLLDQYPNITAKRILEELQSSIAGKTISRSTIVAFWDSRRTMHFVPSPDSQRRPQTVVTRQSARLPTSAMPRRQPPRHVRALLSCVRALQSSPKADRASPPISVATCGSASSAIRVATS